MKSEDSLRHSQLPAPGSILSQLDPFHTTTSFFLKIHLIIILPSVPASPKWTLILRFLRQNLYTPLPHTLYMNRPLHSSGLANPKNIWWAIQTIKLFIMQLPPLPCYHVPHKEKYSPQHPILSHPQPTFLPQYERPSFTPIQSNKDNYYCVCLNF